MREDQIRQALVFLQKNEDKSKIVNLNKSSVKNISFDEKKKFLEGKLTEEEISEVLKRYSE